MRHSRNPWEILREFCHVFCSCAEKRRPSVQVKITAGPTTFQCIGDFTMGFPVDLTAVNAAIKFVDKFGNAAPVEGVPTWTNDREDIAAMVVAADGMSATFTPTGVVGAATIQANGDADLGGGVENVTLIGVLDLTGGKATGGTMEFTPVP